MAMSKSAKAMAEIEKTRAKIFEQQQHLQELEAKHRELENMEIVEIVRGMSIPLDNLAVFLQSMRSGRTSGQVGLMLGNGEKEEVAE